MSGRGAGECGEDGYAGAMVWVTAGGRGQWIKCPIHVTGLWDGGWKKGLLEAVHIAPLFTLTPGLREARGGHMPNSTGGQSCPALALTSLPAPLSPVRYMSAWSLGYITDTQNPLFSHIHSGNSVCFGKTKIKFNALWCRCYLDLDKSAKAIFSAVFPTNQLWFILS